MQLLTSLQRSTTQNRYDNATSSIFTRHAVLVDPYSSNTWYYVFLQQKAYETPEQHTLVVNFDQKGTVSHFDLDKPLPNEEQAAPNNTIINAPEAPQKRWWQFGKK